MRWCRVSGLAPGSSSRTGRERIVCRRRICSNASPTPQRSWRPARSADRRRERPACPPTKSPRGSAERWFAAGNKMASRKRRPSCDVARSTCGTPRRFAVSMPRRLGWARLLPAQPLGPPTGPWRARSQRPSLLPRSPRVPSRPRPSLRSRPLASPLPRSRGPLPRRSWSRSPFPLPKRGNRRRQPRHRVPRGRLRASSRCRMRLAMPAWARPWSCRRPATIPRTRTLGVAKPSGPAAPSGRALSNRRGLRLSRLRPIPTPAGLAGGSSRPRTPGPGVGPHGARRQRRVGLGRPRCPASVRSGR